MRTLTLSNQPQNEAVHVRQIAFVAAFLLPIGKLTEAPAILASHAKGDILLPALLHFLLQAGLLFLVLFAVARSEKTVIERLEEKFGKGVIIFYLLYAAYFLFAVLLPLLDAEKFTYAVFFDTAPTVFSFAFFFILCAFICTKGLKAVGRFADFCLFLFVLPFVSLIALSLVETDFTRLLPLFGTKFGDSFTAFTYTTPHFSDIVLLLPLLCNYRPKKGDAPKILGGYAAGAFCVLFFLAVFFGIYSSIAPREHYAFSKIAQYFPALSVIGRIDLIFVYSLSVVLLYFTCLPVQYATDLLARTFRTNRRVLIATLLSVALFIFTLYCNKYYNGIYALFSQRLYFVFWLIADLLPLGLLLLPAQKTQNTARSKKQKEKGYA